MSWQAVVVVMFGTFIFDADPARSEVSDDSRKNVKVLNQLSKSELTQAMNFIRASLGVHCDFCHVVGEKGWEWGNDEKPQKKRAREMIRMVMEINRANFKGASVVSCFTCHQGRQRPENLPPLPQKDPPYPTVIPDSKIVDTPVQQILDRYKEATGGTARSVITDATTLVMKGTTDETWKHKFVRYEVYYKAPDKWLTRKYMDKGTLTEAWNGVTGWNQNDSEVSKMSEDEVHYFRETVESLRAYPDLPSSTSPVVRKIRLGERDAYSLEFPPKNGVSEHFFFDEQSGLLLRRQRYSASVVGTVPEEIQYDDYKKIEDAHVPFITRSNLVDSWSSGTRSFTEILVNVPLEDSLFEMPAVDP